MDGRIRGLVGELTGGLVDGQMIDGLIWMDE